MLHADDWQSFFAAQAENELGNKNSSVYTEAWSPNKSDATRFQTLVSDINNVVFAVDQDKNIHALHSFKVSGGSLLRPSTKLMCLLGTGSRATAFIIDQQTLLNPCNMITPTIEELEVCSGDDEVKAVNAPAAIWSCNLSRLRIFPSSPLASRHGHVIGNKQLLKAHSSS